MKALIIYLVLTAGMLWNITGQAGSVLYEHAVEACEDNIDSKSVLNVIKELEYRGLKLEVEDSYILLYIYCIKEEYDILYNKYIEYIIIKNSI